MGARAPAARDAALAVVLALVARIVAEGLIVAARIEALWARSALVEGAFLAAVAATVVVRGLDRRRAVPLAPPRLSAALAALAGAAALYAALNELAGPVQEALERLGLEDPAAAARWEEDVAREIRTAPAGIVVSAVVLAAACEEALFRGVLLSGLSGSFGWRAGIVASSLLFGAVHVLPTRVMLTALIGFYLGFVVMATRSLWPAVLAHAANNALVLAVGPDETFEAWKLAAGLAGVAVCVAVLALLAEGPEVVPPQGAGGLRE